MRGTDRPSEMPARTGYTYPLKIEGIVEATRGDCAAFSVRCRFDLQNVAFWRRGRWQKVPMLPKCMLAFSWWAIVPDAKALCFHHGAGRQSRATDRSNTARHCRRSRAGFVALGTVVDRQRRSATSALSTCGIGGSKREWQLAGEPKNVGAQWGSPLSGRPRTPALTKHWPGRECVSCLQGSREDATCPMIGSTA